MEKSAVQWQFDELQKAEKDWAKEVIDNMEYVKRKYEILEQAKQMEVEIKKKSYIDGAISTQNFMKG